MADTAIEWAEKVWNPTTGCDRVSPGCDNCYALTLAKRLKGMGLPKYQTDGEPRTSGPGFGLTVHEDALTLPLTWRQPKRIFVNSMSDLFHDAVPDEFVAEVFAVMALAPQHTFQVLTKRHARLKSLLSTARFATLVANRISKRDPYYHQPSLPLPNVWLGVSVENQQWADIRIPALLETPAAVRWLSCEPLLGPVDLSVHLSGHCPEHDFPSGFCVQRHHPGVQHLGWVVCGGESGPGARPMHPDWARGLRDQCVAGGVPFFFKQHGEWEPLGPLYPQGDDDPDPYDDAHMDAVHLQVVEKKEVVEFERDGTIPAGYQPGDPRTWLMARVGKKRAGRELDGRTWDEYPQAVSAR